MEPRWFSFGLGASLGLSTAFIIDRWRQRDPRLEEQPHLGQQMQGTATSVSSEEATQLGNSKYFKYGAPVPHLSSHTYTAHTLVYDRCKRIPMWVAEVITQDMVDSTTAIANRKRSTYKPDPAVLACHSAANEDYRGSGWSRGHMAPAGNYKSCQKSMDDTFFLTNILPQDFDNNSGYWNRLESYCRELGKRYTQVSIISGPLFLPEKDEKNEKSYVRYEIIGENGVAVPTHLFKIILAEGRRDGDNTTSSGPPAMGVFIVPNEKIGNVDLTHFQVSLEKLEAYTGTIFHSKLDRSKVVDLCTADTCKIMSDEKILLFSYTKKLNLSCSRRQLDELWEEMQSRKVKPDDIIRQTYRKKREEFDSS